MHKSLNFQKKKLNGVYVKSSNPATALSEINKLKQMGLSVENDVAMTIAGSANPLTAQANTLMVLNKSKDSK